MVKNVKLNKIAVYYHGLGGEASLHIKNKMAEFGYYLITETVDFYGEWFKDRGRSFMDKQIKKFKKIDLVIGLSFGGHIAYLLSKETGANLLLINPAVNRARSTTGIHTYVSPKSNKSSNIEIYLGEYDTTVPMQYTLEFFRNTGEEYNAYKISNMQHNMYYHEFDFIVEHSNLVNSHD